MKILITLLKPLSFLPALLMMYLIFSFSAGASYVVMCYNLHGNGTEPGPKADSENINLYDGEMKGEVE